MDEKRVKQARFADVAARSQRVERARALIDQIVLDQKARGNSHFSSSVYQDEPLLKTGRQMASYLPERYREMRAISRWDDPERTGAADGSANPSCSGVRAPLWRILRTTALTTATSNPITPRTTP